MSKEKEQKLKKLRRKKLWPSVLLFFIFFITCFGMIGLIMELFLSYVGTSRMVREKEEISICADRIQTILEEGYTLEEAVEIAFQELNIKRDVVLKDNESDQVVIRGDSRPEFNMRQSVDFEEDYEVYADPENVEWLQEGMHIPMREILKNTFHKEVDKEPRGDKWQEEDVFHAPYWDYETIEDGRYSLYLKGELRIQRREMIYLCAISMVAIVVLTIPLILLAINIFSTIITQKRITKLLYIDTVTGGNNWEYMKHHSDKILKSRWAAKHTFAVVNIQLCRYRDYCNCYGVKNGEELLEAIDRFLEVRVGAHETFGRYANADFGILLCCESEQEAAQRVRSILAEMSGIRPEHNLTFYGGIYMLYPIQLPNSKKCFRRQDVDIDRMYNYATEARVSVEKIENKSFEFFSDKMLDELIWRRKVEDVMEKALEQNEFEVYLQPKYSPKERKLVGAEALVRWNSKTEGLITPNRFIPIFETNGFISKLDDYMISQVAKLQTKWHIEGKKIVPISVNISRVHFAQEDLAEHICSLVDEYGTRHEMIELEVTESAFFDDQRLLYNTVRKLKEYGFLISMDDFGAGYSSLNSLKDLPLDVLKLDMEFFREEETSKRGEIVVKEIIQLAKNLDMQIVAEGIERKEQVDFLAEQSCDMIQGYYFAKPMPVAEFEDKVASDG